MHPVELEQLIRQGETQDVEFESSIPGAQTIARHLAALANTNGGMLILGVQEPGEVVGINQHRAREVIEQSRQYLAPMPVLNVQSLQIREHTVVVVQVSPSEELHSAMGGYFSRGARPTAVLENREGATRPMNPTEIRLHVLKGKTEDAALSRLATALADQSRTISKQVEEIDKLGRKSASADSAWIKFALVFAGAIAGMLLISLAGCSA